MSEQMNFTEENKKTVISFIAGLVIGGLLVYIFALPTDEKVVEDNDSDNDSELVADENESEDKESNLDDSEEELVRTSPTTTSAVAPVVREGTADVDNQSAGGRVELSEVTFPTDAGWGGIREYENGQVTGLLGVARFSAIEGLYPTGVNLLRGTVAGRTYAVVFYHDNGDKVFNLANDSQIQTEITTFVAR